MKPARFLSASLPTLLLTFALAPVFQASAASYASGISITGTTVNFTLNEPADLVTYSINGGAPQTLADASKGQKSFSLGSASDTFSITAVKNSATGYTIPTGGTIAAATNGLGAASNEAGFNLISSEGLGTLTGLNSPRGLAVATSPNNPNFGTTYLSNSAAGTAASGRVVGDGLYAIKADQSDAFGYGDTAQTGGLSFAASASSPFRLNVGTDNKLYIADWSDNNGTVYSTSGNLTSGAVVLAGIGGAAALPVGQNHGSVTAVHVTGSAAAGDLKVFTIDEDLTSAQVGGVSTTDRNSVWSYDLGSTSSGFSGTPTKINTATPLVGGAVADMDRGANGLFYLSQYRSAGNEAGIIVMSEAGGTLFDSRIASVAGVGPDVFRHIQGVAVSPDGKTMAVLLSNSDIAIIPLDENGIPQIDERTVVNTGTDTTTVAASIARDLAFDAAGNIHFVSGGQGGYRVIAPGGYTSATTSFDGTSYSFTVVPEPTGTALALGGLLAAAGRRRRRVTV